MNEDAPTLLPCLFCGGESELVTGLGEWSVLCRSCQASSALFADTTAAIAAWNRRAPSVDVEALANEIVNTIPADWLNADEVVVAVLRKHLAAPPPSDDDPQKDEMDSARRLLRELCADFGDNDWPDDLHLYDVIEKHLALHLYEEHGDQEPYDGPHDPEPVNDPRDPKLTVTYAAPSDERREAHWCCHATCRSCGNAPTEPRNCAACGGMNTITTCSERVLAAAEEGE